jgi:DNA modification methylase
MSDALTTRIVPSVQVFTGDCLDILPTLPAESVQCVVTSPPYWNLRDYGTGQWSGGDAACAHEPRRRPHGPNAARPGRRFTADDYQREHCRRCGAQRIDRQLGLEETPQRYIERIVQVFVEIRRVLRNDGTVWLNLGDTYATHAQGHGGFGTSTLDESSATRQNVTRAHRRGIGANVAAGSFGLKDKDLVGLPWRVAFALQEAGWYLRSDIIWAKPSPMPESVRDRPTKSHEYVFLLAKCSSYFYDAEAIKEPVTGNAHHRSTSVNPKAKIPTGWDTGPGGHNELAGRYRSRQNESFAAAVAGLVSMRNKRSVWTIASRPYPEAHFATFPEALVEPCILAGSREGDVVLDPFAGSGTALAVAKRLGRSAVGIELNEEYVSLIHKRLDAITMPLPLYAGQEEAS